MEPMSAVRGVWKAAARSRLALAIRALPCSSPSRLGSQLPAVSSTRALSTSSTPRTTKALSTATVTSTKGVAEARAADHSWRQQNHIWTDEEIAQCIASKDKHHEPKDVTDHIMGGVMRGLYHTFNFITWYEPKNPTPRSIEWRLIILESIAGVPGFIAAAFRHFYSLRTLQRDHGFIYTFLEEAENERMHLLVCLKMFDAGLATRVLVIAAQVLMTPVLVTTYFIRPAAMHRFVGYLEETAINTYANIVQQATTPGTKLHAAWADLPAPEIAVSYWALEKNARWVTALRHMLADEAHHRDVNHAVASLPKGAENPFIKEHMADFDAAVKRRAQALLEQALEHESRKAAK